MAKSIEKKSAFYFSETSSYRCPKCKQVWLLIDVAENERHQCTICGNSFTANQNTRYLQKAASGSTEKARN